MHPKLVAFGLISLCFEALLPSVSVWSHSHHSGKESGLRCLVFRINKNLFFIWQGAINGHLFFIKHLLILREQIAPFDVDFAVKEVALDFTKMKTAAFGLLSKGTRLLSLSTNNAILEFLLEVSLFRKL